jgi:iron complex outermembrane receptor protein
MDLTYQTKQQFAVEQDPLLVQKAYTMVNLSAGVRHPERGLTASVFVRNLLDETYFSGMSHASTLASPQFPNEVQAYIPRDADRLYGVTLGAKF